MYELTDLTNKLVSSPATAVCCLALVFIATAVLALTRWRTLYGALCAAKAAAEPKSHKNGVTGEGEKPKISIVVPTCNEAANLEANLPKLLRQNYSGSFEVIVCDENSSDDTALVLQRLKEQHQTLRTTFIPATSRNITPRKLALTLGVRAARSEWVVVVNPDSEPASDLWLEHLSDFFHAGTDFVGAYTNYEYTQSSFSRRTLFETLLRQAENAVAQAHGTILGAETCNIAFRKTWFLAQNGFADSLSLPFGEEAILANAHAEASRSVFPLCSRCRTTQEAPSASLALTLRVQRAEARRHMPNKSTAYRWDNALHAVAAQLVLWISVFYAALRTVQCTDYGFYALRDLYTDVPFVVLLVVAAAVPTLLCNKLCKLLGEPSLGGSLAASALLAPARTLHTRLLRYAHRPDFVRNYLEHTS